jgi:3D (Asp-Asp-Asp) domain-containing protein
MMTENFLLKFLFFPLFCMLGLCSCVDEDKANEKIPKDWYSMTVTASAYNSLLVQGEGNPKITAWGDTLRPGVRSIAVSRDLIKKGLTHNTPVKIEGFEGTFIVNDKMHSRWKNKIDIYMGLNKKKAMEWGRKKVKISFPASSEIDLKPKTNGR